MNVRSSQVNFSASIDWSYSEDYFSLIVRNPLGMVIAKLEGNGELLKITLPPKSEEIISSKNLHRYIGHDLPLNHLPFWVKGLPNPDYDFIGKATSFDQDGWSVSYSQYQDLLPRKITFQREDLVITLVIASWVVDL